jgi:hypothetical protein
MNRVGFPPALAILTAIAGCNPAVPPPATVPDRPAYQVERPAEPVSTPRAERPVAQAGTPEVSYDTERDRVFADFLRAKSGGMLRKAAVGLERKGELKVELDQSVAPDDTLPLTKSLMAGARKDFPDRPITLSVYDPAGEPILKAYFRPGHGVKYQIAHEGGSRTAEPKEEAPPPSGPGDVLARSGVTENDRKFAAWANEHGRAYLRYVEADLERHGRLWFGVTPEVKPADVPDLTKSLLEGAHKEFPGKELVATVFDPEGERIGRAHLGADGRVRWER